MTQPKEQQKSYNIGLALLRALCCFEVLLGHYWRVDLNTPPPVFLAISR